MATTAQYNHILKLFTLINDPTQTHLINIREPILFENFNNFLASFTMLEPSERDKFSPIDIALFDYLNTKGQIRPTFPDILNPRKPRVPILKTDRNIVQHIPGKLRTPILYINGNKNTSTEQLFNPEHIIEIIPVSENMHILNNGSKVFHKLLIEKIIVEKLSNGKIVIQQPSIVSCGTSALAMLLTDNNIPINDNLIKLIGKNVGGNSLSHGTECEEFPTLLGDKFPIPNKYFLNDKFNTTSNEYTFIYLRHIITNNGSILITTTFESDSGHWIILDSIDDTGAIIRDPYHGVSMKIKTDIFLTRIYRFNNNIEVSYFSRNPHTYAYTDEEEAYRIANAKQKYLKYKTKYLQLKNKI